MQCHFCDRDADVAVEKDGVKVGVCERHFREQMDDLSDSEWVESIAEDVDVDRRD